MILVLRDSIADDLRPERAMPLVGGGAKVVIFASPGWRGEAEWRGLEDFVEIKMVGCNPGKVAAALNLLLAREDDVLMVSWVPQDQLGAELAGAECAETLEEAAALIEEGVEDGDNGERGLQGRPADRRTRDEALGKAPMEDGGLDSDEWEGPWPPGSVHPRLRDS